MVSIIPDLLQIVKVRDVEYLKLKGKPTDIVDLAKVKAKMQEALDKLEKEQS